jgi:hypothetical protein
MICNLIFEVRGVKTREVSGRAKGNITEGKYANNAAYIRVNTVLNNKTLWWGLWNLSKDISRAAVVQSV